MTAHPVPIELLEEFHLLEVGTTRSGKTYALRGLLEMLRRADRRVGAVDKLGNHWGLTRSIDGKGPGLEFVIFGGKHGHLPMQPTDGDRLGRLFVERSIPAIFDVSQWKSHEQERWVADLADAVFEANYGRGPLHLSLDEAQSWAPQGTSSLSTASVRRLAEQGAGNGILLILAVQRLARLDISVRNLAQAVIALRQPGVADRRALRDLVEADVEDAKAFDAALPRLETGEGFLWTPGAASLIRTRFPTNTTFDSSRTPKHGDVESAPAPAISKLVVELRAALQPTKMHEADANMHSGDADLNERVAELEAELADAEDVIAALTEDAVAMIERVADAMELLKGCLVHSDKVPAVVAEDAVGGVSRSAPPTDRHTNSNLAGGGEDAAGAVFGERAPAALSKPAKPPRPPRAPAAPGELNSIAQKILATLRTIAPARVTWAQAAQLSGCSPKSGPYWAGKRQLIEASEVEDEAGFVWLLGPDRGGLDFDQAWEAWRKVVDGFAPRMLDVLRDRKWISRTDLGARMGVSTKSGPWWGGLKALRERGLIEENGPDLRLASPLPGAARQQKET